MQTDCPTEDVRDRKMERSNDVRMRMRCMIVSKKMRLCKKSYLTQGTQNLPHLQAKDKKGQTRTEKKRQHKQKQVKQEQRFDEQEDGCVRDGAGEASNPPRSDHSCSPFHAAPAFASFSWCISGPPASVLPPHLHSAHSEPSYHG